MTSPSSSRIRTADGHTTAASHISHRETQLGAVTSSRRARSSTRSMASGLTLPSEACTCRERNTMYTQRLALVGPGQTTFWSTSEETMGNTCSSGNPGGSGRGRSMDTLAVWRVVAPKATSCLLILKLHDQLDACYVCTLLILV